MKRIFCCLNGESSNKEPPQPPKQNAPQDPPKLPNDRSGSLPLLARCGVTFRWEQILTGTGNFLESNFLGQGSFGKVYRCDLPGDNTVGAAKIQKQEHRYAYREFVAEVTTLHRANHPNVVRLLGKCFDRGHPYTIVYELMPNGSLDRHLFAQASSPEPSLQQKVSGLGWETRISIALGVAEALVHLHKKLKVIHRDIKLSNILLDENFVPKLADFGLATKFFISNGVEREQVIRPVQGTMGCIAPETEHFGSVSTKSDVYSYGVLLFPLLTGKKAYDEERPPQKRKIADWLIPVCGRVQNMPMVVDVALGNRYPEEGLISLFLVASMCIDPQVSARPDMGFVEDMVRLAAAHKVPERPTVTKRVSI
ncbi:unnamed protein product [Cochlearia groenlandica]